VPDCGYFLRVWTRRRLWWTLWIVVEWEELEMHPPPNVTAREVFKWAEDLRETGAGVKVEHA
jgi:hypothetical protein